MADVLVQLASGRGSILCDNCGATQSNEIRLYWNDTQNRLEIQKECICHTVASPAVKYEEDYDVGLVAK